jgi:hypothetical protein
MSGKIPSEAFDFYINLGPARSYQTVAEHFRVSKRSVTKCAAREGWQDRIHDIEKNSRASADLETSDAFDGMTARHLKTIHFIQARALQALKDAPIKNAVDAVRALDIAIRQERNIAAAEMASVIRKPEAKKPSERLIEELPAWLITICASVLNWGEEELVEHRLIQKLIEDLGAWLDDLAGQKLLVANQPAEEMLLQAFAVENDAKKHAVMLKKILRLDDEIERQRILNKIAEDHDDLDRDPAGPFAWVAEELRKQGARS